MTMVVKNTVNQFFGLKLWVQIVLKVREYEKKSALKQKIDASLYTLDQGFKKISFALYTYVLAKILQNDAKFRYAKAGFKKLQEFEQLQTGSGKSNKLKFDSFYLKKYIPLSKTLHTVNLCNITFN